MHSYFSEKEKINILFIVCECLVVLCIYIYMYCVKTKKSLKGNPQKELEKKDFRKYKLYHTYCWTLACIKFIAKHKRISNLLVYFTKIFLKKLQTYYRKNTAQKCFQLQ